MAGQQVKSGLRLIQWDDELKRTCSFLERSSRKNVITKCRLVCSMCTADKLSFTFDTEYLFGHLGWVRSGEEPDWSEIGAEIEIDPMSFLVVAAAEPYSLCTKRVWAAPHPQ